MKKSLLVLVPLLFSLIAQTAFADNSHNRRSHSYAYYDHGYYDRRHNHYYSQNRHSYSRGHHHHYDFSTGSFVGGLLLGSVLTYSYSPPVHNTYYYSNPPVSRQSVVIKSAAPTLVINQGGGRHLLRDLQGRCFEVTNEGSTQVRTELPSAACNF